MPDRISGQGPLGGLESCFRRAKTEKCLVLGVDTPLVPVEELQNLLKFAMEKADQPVTMLCHNGKEESLIAVYDARLYKEITDFLASDASDYNSTSMQIAYRICKQVVFQAEFVYSFVTSGKLGTVYVMDQENSADRQTFIKQR